MASASTGSKQMPCLICGQVQPKNSFLAHISEHLNYKQHKCQDCAFESVTAEEMADHEAANPDHFGQLYILRNPYMDRVCRFIYNDCDYGERNGGLEKVLKRKLVSAADEESQQQQLAQNVARTEASVTSGIVKAEECALPSPKVMPNSGGTTMECRSLDDLQQPAFPTHQQWQSMPLSNPAMIATSGLAGSQQPIDYEMKLNLDEGHFYQHQMEEVRSEFTTQGGGMYFDQQMVGTSSAGMPSSSLENFIVQQPQHAHQQHRQFHEYNEEEAADEGGDHRPIELCEDGNEQDKKGKKKYKEVFENVQCLKCGQWVKGRGICLLYHMNTRHLKLPLYRCLACPRDFFYVTDTTAKNHIRSFHGNDLSLLENNYPALSKQLYNSRREFYGPSKSDKRAGMVRNMKMKAAKRLNGIGQKGRGKPKALVSTKPIKEISMGQRPQAGSGVAGNSSHVQCNACGELVASIYSSQLGHMNTKHLHLAIYECRACQRPFESLSMSAAVIHVKSTHAKKNRAEAELEIADHREECLKKLNEQYRAFFS